MTFLVGAAFTLGFVNPPAGQKFLGMLFASVCCLILWPFILGLEIKGVLR